MKKYGDHPSVGPHRCSHLLRARVENCDFISFTKVFHTATSAKNTISRKKKYPFMQSSSPSRRCLKICPFGTHSYRSASREVTKIVFLPLMMRFFLQRIVFVGRAFLYIHQRLSLSISRSFINIDRSIIYGRAVNRTGLFSAYPTTPFALYCGRTMKTLSQSIQSYDIRSSCRFTVQSLLTIATQLG